MKSVKALAVVLALFSVGAQNGERRSLPVTDAMLEKPIRPTG